MAKVKKNNTTFRVTEPSNLADFLLLKLGGATRNRIKGLLAHRLIMVNQSVQTRADYALKAGDTVVLIAGKGNTELHHPKLRILYEDNNFIVVEKKQGLLTVAANPKSAEETVFSILKHYVKKQDIHNGIYVVHRLDRETSGVLLFVKTPQLQEYMRTYWQDLVRERVYIALAEGVFSEPEGTIRTWLTEDPQTGVSYSSPVDDGGKLSITHYRVLKSINPSTEHPVSLVELSLETGRTNQIRVHLASIGHPVVGDRKYGRGNTQQHQEAVKRGLLPDRLCLHAKRIAFINPITEQPISFEAKGTNFGSMVK